MKKEKSQTPEQVLTPEQEDVMREQAAKLFKEQVQAREEAEIAAENIDDVVDPISDDQANEDVLEELDDDYISDEEWEAMSDEEKAEYEESIEEDADEGEEEDDPEYLKTSPEVVGFDNRRQQAEMYDIACEEIRPKESVLDFGCGRGDLYDFLYRRNGSEPKYKGVDINEPLINAGIEKYAPNINVECKHWNDLQDTDKSNWCVNIGSLCARYDSSEKDNFDIVTECIDKMMSLCTAGSVLILFSSYMPENMIEEEYLITDPRDVFDYAIKKYGQNTGNVSLDHSYSDSAYKITILKQQQ